MTSLEQLAEKMRKAKEKPKKHPFPFLALLMKRERPILGRCVRGLGVREDDKPLTKSEKLLVNQENARLKLEKEKLEFDKKVLKMAEPKKEPNRPNPFVI